MFSSKSSPKSSSKSSSNLRRFALSVALALSFVQAASASDILIGDAKSQPESLTIAPGGVLIVGSASSPFIYKVKPGATTTHVTIEVSPTVTITSSIKVPNSSFLEEARSSSPRHFSRR